MAGTTTITGTNGPDVLRASDHYQDFLNHDTFEFKGGAGDDVYVSNVRGDLDLRTFKFWMQVGDDTLQITESHGGGAGGVQETRHVVYGFGQGDKVEVSDAVTDQTFNDFWYDSQTDSVFIEYLNRNSRDNPVNGQGPALLRLVLEDPSTFDPSQVDFDGGFNTAAVQQEWLDFWANDLWM